MTSALTAKNLEKVILDCLFQDNEDKSSAIIVEGITSKFGFHPGRLEAHRAEIISMLSELPKEFHAGSGGGWSFLNACMTKDGVQWGEHPDIEALCVLGIGLGLVAWCLLRSMWSMLPGSMPYFVVKVN